MNTLTRGRRRTFLRGFLALGAAVFLVFVSFALRSNPSSGTGTRNVEASARFQPAERKPSSGRCDADEDGTIGMSDAAILRLYWNAYPEPEVDCNGDGRVDVRDAGILFAGWTDPQPDAAEFPNRAMPARADERPRAAFTTEAPAPLLGQRFTVYATLASAVKPVAAVHMRIRYDRTHLRLLRMSEAPSVFRVWLDEPRPLADDVIVFAAGAPGGYRGSEGVMLAMEFEALAPGSARFGYAASEMAAADSATALSELFDAEYEPLEITVGEDSAPGTLPEPDVDPPDPFDVIFLRIPSPGGVRSAAAFFAQDEGSGIAAYEIHDGSLTVKQVEPLYMLHRPGPGDLLVYAIDGAGNRRASVLRYRSPASP